MNDETIAKRLSEKLEIYFTLARLSLSISEDSPEKQSSILRMARAWNNFNTEYNAQPMHIKKKIFYTAEEREAEYQLIISKWNKLNK